MRLSDGQIKECAYGVAIELASDNFAAWQMVTWTYLFIFNGDQKAINEMVINKIEDCQQRLSYWQRLKEAAKVAHKNEWILLSEQLPEVGKNVLVCDDDGDIYYSHRVNISQDKWAFYDEWGDKIKSLIAWCHLPEPYKAECDEAFDMAFKVLKQEPIIDKIRAEIIKIYEREGNSVDCLNALNELKWFIDKYKGESEV